MEFVHSDEIIQVRSLGEDVQVSMYSMGDPIGGDVQVSMYSVRDPIGEDMYRFPYTVCVIL